ncbi:hypothetical protein CA54_07270 [Symmachiella macrocystis]|uniref:Uncharacterized protein n=1 Tax=Symmachiella macrocystis TaxID=2527985 RepID=A0A5C6BIQ9_9PLAN|nr:hypothetical protein CA54_07270 [Symmachiella macrocystis]
MAVEIEFANVIIRKSAIEAKYPGGLDGFAESDLPNYIEDDTLVRVGFMSTGEAHNLAGHLSQHGLTLNETAQSDVAVVQVDSIPDWLTIGPVDNSIGCWLIGTDPGSLIKGTNGFLLCCPRDLFDRLELVLESISAEVERSEPPNEDRNEFFQVVHFSCGNASISANVIGEKSGNSPVGLWGRRDLSRRQHCAGDVRFAEAIESVLLANGAKNR